MLIAERDPLSSLYHHLHQEMEAVNQLILTSTKSSIPLVEQIIYHLVKAGGKRLRPLLTLATSRLFADHSTLSQPNYTTEIAAAVELFHTATLLHDDVIDESSLRRNKPTANAVWGEAPSILVGDFLFSKSFQLMIEAKDLRVLNILSKATAQIAEGEVLQLTALADLNLKLETYLEIIGAKTAALFGACCQAGGMSVHAPKELEGHLYHFGYNLGIVFQIADDILDYQHHPDSTAKTAGTDFYEAKVTLPILLISSHANYSNNTAKTIHQWFNKPKRDKQDFIAIRQLLFDCDIFSHCHKYTQPFIEKALFHLEKLPQGEIHQQLKRVVFYCLTRNC